MTQHTAPTMGELIGLDPAERTRLLLAREEDQWFDRKGAGVEPKDLGKLLVAFANAEGGLVAIGIRDGEIEGVDDRVKEINGWRQAAATFTQPHVRHRFEQVTCVDRTGRSRYVVLIEVETDGRFYQTTSGHVFLRAGDSTRELPPDLARDLQLDKGTLPYDGTTLPDLDLSVLDEDRISAYAKSLPAVTDPAAALRARGFVGDLRGEPRPTVGAVLLFGHAPQAVLPGARMRVIQCSGTERETGARSNVIEDRECGGALTDQIDQARAHVAELLPKARRLQPSGRFASVPLVPTAAWQEAIVNAALHRNYAITGDHTRIELFSDRLEVTSPGRLPGFVTLQNMQGTRYARNPHIARAMTELGYGRELAEGVRRMYGEMSAAGLPEPLFAQGPSSLTVRFLFLPEYRELIRLLPQRSEGFLEFIRTHERLATRDGERLLGLRRPATIELLRRLEDEGYLRWQGLSERDPRAYWLVTVGMPAWLRPRRGRTRPPTRSAGGTERAKAPPRSRRSASGSRRKGRPPKL